VKAEVNGGDGINSVDKKKFTNLAEKWV